jgi:transposase
MEPIIERCCGMDVGEASVTVCLLTGKAHEKTRKAVRSFGAVTRELLALKAWLLSEGCTHVAMESTGIYWLPVYAALEDSFDITLANAQHIKNVPGRKTDVKDSEWIADLLRHGLLKKSFVPPKQIRELRDLVRYRRKLVEARSSERNRLLKLLESANVKISSVISDVFGASGMLMLRALLTGEASPGEMAELAKGALRKKLAELELALEGRIEHHHRFLLGLQLRRLGQLDADIGLLDARIEEKMAPFRPQADLLIGIPGVNTILAATLIAEMGVDMSFFPTARHLAAWAGVCPGNHESAGKRRNVKVRKGNTHLKTVLIEAANAASRAKGTYLKDKFFRLKARRGHKRAAMAIAHKILSAAYHLLSKGIAYKDLGEAYLDTIRAAHVARTLVHRLRRLGYTVQIEKAA